ncbi:MAG: hypothetical protein WCD20_21420 [Rhodomicrobium sp.]
MSEEGKVSGNKQYFFPVTVKPAAEPAIVLAAALTRFAGRQDCGDKS